MKHLTDIASLSDKHIQDILARAEEFAQGISSSALNGKSIFTLFFENSTRTRISFELAVQRLGGNVITVDLDKSSLKKGETFLDTIQTLNAMSPDAVIVRHSEYDAPGFIAKNMDCPVLNAGDAWRAHPTQALLDALTIRQAKGAIEGLHIAICGDIAHSRVASSNMALLSRLGAHIHVIAPPALMPDKFPADNIEGFDNLKEGFKGCDIVMMLRLQKERMETGLAGSDQDYHAQYGLTTETLRFAKPDTLVMHPGPMNRGVEIDDDIADDPQRSLILKQVSNGVFVRMAALELLING